VSLAIPPSRCRQRKKQALGLFLASLLLALFCTACSSGVLGGGNWQLSGLLHSHVQTVAAQVGTPTTLYAATEQGHVFSSVDSGQHWIEHSSGLPLPDSIHMLATSLNGQML